jgi:hypothetical protein
MTMNQPVLPLLHALKVLLAIQLGLAVVLKTAELAGKNLLNLVLLGADGFALALLMILTSTLVSNFMVLSTAQLTIFLIVCVLCIGILAFTSILYVWKKVETTSLQLFLAAITIAYPFGTVFHYLFGTDGHFYITNSDNFFTKNIFLQIFVWIVGYLITLFLSRLRNIAIEKSSSSIFHN